MLDINEIFNGLTKSKKSTTETPQLERKPIYGTLCRVSTQRQSEEGFSLELQQKLAKELAEKNNAIIYDYYIEDGLSASKTRIDKRPELQRLMQDVIDGKINTVIAYKRDRMFRNSLEYMEFLKLLIDNNCELILTATGETQVDLKNLQGFGQIFEYILSVFAQMEAETTSTRVSDALISRALGGNRTGGVLPIGYQYTSDGQFIEPMSEMIPVIDLIEDMYLSGVGMGSIAKWMNGGDIRNYPTLPVPIPKPFQNFKNAVPYWNNKNIQTILFNTLYVGYVSFQSNKNEDMERIIKESPIVKPIRTLERQKEINDFAKTKSLTRKPPRAYNTPFLLTGILFCEECGNSFITSTSKQKDGVSRSYYKCRSRKNSKNLPDYECSHSKIYRKEILENMVLQTIKDTLEEVLNDDTYEFFEKMSEESKGRENEELLLLDKKIKEKELEFNNITKIVAQISDTQMQLTYIESQTEILKSLNELKETRSILVEKLDVDIEEKYDFEKFLETAKEFGRIIEYSPVNVQKILLEGFIDKILINKKGDVSIELGIEIAKKDGSPTIPYNTLAHPTGYKHIIGHQSTEGLITLNYNDFIEETREYIRNNFYQFILEKEPKFKVENHHLITEEEYEKILISENPYFIEQKVNRYIQDKLGITAKERGRLVNNKLISFKSMMSVLDKLNSSLDEFNDYILNIHPEAIDIKKENFVEAILNNGSVRGEIELNINTPRHQIFKGKLICGECGKLFSGSVGRTLNSLNYRCPSGRRNEDDTCNNSKGLREDNLISRIEDDLKIEKVDLNDKDLILSLAMKVKNITVGLNAEILSIEYMEEGLK